jgi:hypothetical protein
MDELKNLIVVENKKSLLSVIEKIYDKTDLQDILYRSKVNVNILEHKKSTTQKIKPKNIKPENLLYKEFAGTK